MTRRRASNKKPTGPNRSLGNELFNERAQALKKHKVRNNRTNESIAPANQASTMINIDSVTDETGLEEFLARAELADANFTAIKEDARIIEATTAQLPIVISTHTIADLKERFADRLKIPRRPHRDLYETADELTKVENANFLKWREELAELQEKNGVLLTPFERNLQLWRQLWRVIERSDIIVQIVDARNPLLFRNLDLEVYIKECGISKQMICLVNKADLLTEEQISMWRKWFIENDVDVVFWTSVEPENATSTSETNIDESETSNQLSEVIVEKDAQTNNICPFFRTPSELIGYLKLRGCASVEHPLVVGMVGYPNVGKSSTINRLIGLKKVSVSATPGKTRYLQTIILDPELTLCDCPGLVMPSFALSTSEMLLNGILPVDHARDCLSPIALLASRVPRKYLENLYSIMLGDFVDEDGQLNAQDILTAISFMRGYMVEGGVADCSRTARFLLKDVVSGRLKLVVAPPNTDQSEFDKYTYQLADQTLKPNAKQCNVIEQLEKRKLIEREGTLLEKLDKEFFGNRESDVHVHGILSGPGANSNRALDTSKKHFNRNKRQKLRKIYAD